MTPESGTTAPFTEAKQPEPKSFTSRLPEHLLERLDARAKEVGLSRNAWLEQAVEWVLTNLPHRMGNPDRDRAASEAPREVAGTEKRPRPGHRHRPQKSAGGDFVCTECGEVLDMGPRSDF